MARNFPNSPSNGDTVTFNGATYIYNSSNNSWDAETASASGIALTSLSVGTPGTASGSGSLSYNNTTGVFTYTPPDIGSYATESYVDTAITNLVDAAPGALDTLNELAAAIGDDPSFATTVTNSIALKAPLASPALTGTPTAPTATVGTNTTQIATTAFVQGALGSISGNSITDGVSTLDFTGNDLRLDTNFIPSADVTYDLGSATARWKDLYLSGNSINLGGAVISSDGSAIDLPAGSTLGGSAIGGGTADFTASGAIAAGAAVILNTDGTVSSVGETTVTGSFPEISTAPTNYGLGNRVGSGGSGQQQTITAIDRNYWYHMFTDGDDSNASRGGYLRVLYQDDAGGLGFGSSVDLTGLGNTSGTFIVPSQVMFCSDGTHLAFYSYVLNSAYTQEWRTVSRSGTTITLGSANTVDLSGQSANSYFQVFQDPTQADRFIIFFVNTSTNTPYVIVATWSGSTVNFGSPIQIGSNLSAPAYTFRLHPTVTGRYVWSSSTNIYTGVIDYAQGTSTIGAANRLSSGFGSVTGLPAAEWDPNDTNGTRIVVFADTYPDSNDGWGWGGRVGYLNATSNSFTFPGGWMWPATSWRMTDYPVIQAVPGAPNYYTVGIRTYISNSYGSRNYILKVNTSNDSFSLSNQNSGGDKLSFGSDSYGKYIMTGQYSNPDITFRYGSLDVFESNLDTTKLLGISSSTVADTGTATIVLDGGVSEDLTGLTTGSQYYVQGSGTLNTAADSYNAKMGKALSATKFLVDLKQDATVSYSDLTNKPTIPADISDLTDTGGLLSRGGITISDTSPSSPSSGDLWFDSTALSLYMYYDDGSSAQWLQIS